MSSWIVCKLKGKNNHEIQKNTFWETTFAGLNMEKWFKVQQQLPMCTFSICKIMANDSSQKSKCTIF